MHHISKYQATSQHDHNLQKSKNVMPEQILESLQLEFAYLLNLDGQMQEVEFCKKLSEDAITETHGEQGQPPLPCSRAYDRHVAKAKSYAPENFSHEMHVARLRNNGVGK